MQGWSCIEAIWLQAELDKILKEMEAQREQRKNEVRQLVNLIKTNMKKMEDIMKDMSITAKQESEQVRSFLIQKKLRNRNFLNLYN